MTVPTVSVIIPLYNKAATISRTIESVLTQSMANFEVIVVDDGSSDAGPHLVREVADRRIRLHCQPNAGPGPARNAGLLLSRAPLVTFIDADDRWDPVFLQTAVRVLDEYPQCDVFTCDVLLHPSGKRHWEKAVDRVVSAGAWRLKPESSPAEAGNCVAWFTSISTVYRKTVVQQHGGFFAAERCTLGEDVYLWIQIVLNHMIYRHPAPLAHYHMESSQLGLSARRGALPYEPVFTHADAIRRACPPELRDHLELWLARHAMRTSFLQLDVGAADRARWLLDQFPAMRRWVSEYRKLRARMLFPRSWLIMRRVRQLLAEAR
jgi:glycosyltransferase involved in cell wall biosynthesis